MRTTRVHDDVATGPHVERWRAEVNDYCRSIGVRYIPVEAERSLDAILLGDFRRYGLLE